jgi:hypothetical protein
VSKAGGERLDDLPLEVDSRVRGKYGLPVASRDLTETIAEDIRLDSACDERDLRPLVPRDLGRRMQGDRVPAVNSSMPLARRKSRAAFAPSTSNRWSGLRYFSVSPKSWKTAPKYSNS